MPGEVVTEFITWLHPDAYGADPESLRDSARWYTREYRQAPSSGLLDLIRTRELTVLDVCLLCHADFDSEDDLYVYLQKLHDYLLCGAAEQPEIPF